MGLLATPRAGDVFFTKYKNSGFSNPKLDEFLALQPSEPLMMHAGALAGLCVVEHLRDAALRGYGNYAALDLMTDGHSYLSPEFFASNRANVQRIIRETDSDKIAMGNAADFLNAYDAEKRPASGRPAFVSSQVSLGD